MHLDGCYLPFYGWELFSSHFQRFWIYLSFSHAAISQAFPSLKVWRSGAGAERGVHAGANKRIFWCHDFRFFRFVIDWVGWQTDSVRETLQSVRTTQSIYKLRRRQQSKPYITMRRITRSLSESRRKKGKTCGLLFGSYYLRGEPTLFCYPREATVLFWWPGI